MGRELCGRRLGSPNLNNHQTETHKQHVTEKKIIRIILERCKQIEQRWEIEENFKKLIRNLNTKLPIKMIDKRIYMTSARGNTYTCLCSMIQRCHNPNRLKFHSYGGRGIIVCDEWRGRGGLDNFIKDMGLRPSYAYEIHRKDNDGNYCKENCVWILKTEHNKFTKEEQMIKRLRNLIQNKDKTQEQMEALAIEQSKKITQEKGDLC